MQKSMEDREVSKRKNSCITQRKHLRVHTYEINGGKNVM